MIRAKQKTNKKLRPSANTRTYDLRKREINLNNGLTSNELKRKTLNNSQFFVFKEKCNRGRTLWPFVGNVKSRCFHADPTRFELTEREPHAAQWLNQSKREAGHEKYVLATQSCTDSLTGY